MKKTILTKMVILVCLVWLSFSAFGQGDSIIIQPNGQNYSDYFNSITQLESSRIPTGYLYDKVYPTARLDSIDPCDTIEVYDIFQGWWEMENAQVPEVQILSYDSMRRMFWYKTYLIVYQSYLWIWTLHPLIITH